MSVCECGTNECCGTKQAERCLLRLTLPAATPPGHRVPGSRRLRGAQATASLKFLRQLETDFDMDDVVAVPNWFFTTDDCSVWTRKAGDPVELAEDA